MKKFVIAVSTVFSAVSIAQAQDLTNPPDHGVTPDPCAIPIPAGQQLAMDFGQFCVYDKANPSLPAATDHRVIYFGDSITYNWGQRIVGLQKDDVLNRGIGGQTTAQMLVRFKADVLNLRPRVVHILAGTNDVAGNTGPTTIARIEDAISSMVEQAKAHKIRVVLASILPAAHYPWSPTVDPIPSIKTLNTWMQSYAAQQGIVYVDYFSALNDGHGAMANGTATDGVHPNLTGYKIMEPLAAQAIQDANK